MNMEVVISIVGAFGTFALSINAYFLRGIFQDLNTVKIELAKMVERSDAKEERISKIEVNEKEIFDRLNILEREVLKWVMQT